jgi:tetratricopeptide (TPR) repeat protein
VFELDPDYIEELLQESVAEICRHEDFKRFLKWMQKKMGIHQQSLFVPAVLADNFRLATLLAVAIWNVVPLPRQGFQIKKMSFPAGNEICLCGSGKKFKHCCDIDRMPFEHVDSDIVWLLVFANVSPKILKDALKKNQIPLLGRIQGAIAGLEEDRPKMALMFLETFFNSDSPGETGEDGAFALTLLLDAYDVLGFAHKKIKTIEHVISTAPASPLRSEAYQRLATIRMDQDEAEEAWQLFRKAQVDTPDDFMIGLLEVQLLLAERRFDRAQERARFLIKRMKKQGVDAEFALDFLVEVAEDPRKGSLRMEFAAVQDVGLELVDWLEEVAGRRLPVYLFKELEPKDFPEEDTEGVFQEISPGDYVLVPPKSLEKCEKKWEHFCPVEKSISIMGSFDEFPWQPDADYDWIDFLRRYPQSFDSLSILEDVLQLIDLHPNRWMPEFAECIQVPVIKRALAIFNNISAALPQGGHLPWIVLSNRPLHHIVFKHGLELLQEGRMEEFFQVAEQILTINPNDNHGVRARLVNIYLDAGRYQQALAVCAGRPDDILAEIVYGRVLALYCLGEEREASRAAEDAVKKLPLVAHYLLAGRVRAPKEDLDLRFSGGLVEAYLYRIDMRSVWKASGNALKWLKKTIPPPR